jgi:hypothetical protein
VPVAAWGSGRAAQHATRARHKGGQDGRHQEPFRDRQRAATVRAALVTAGVPPARIETNGSGEERQPTARPDTARPDTARPDDAAEPHKRVVDITVIRPAA